VLALVPDPRQRRGRRYLLVFILAVAVACALAGARNFREAGDHAADLPQEVLRRLGGRPHPLLRRIIAPSETRIRTLIQAIGADLLDDLIGGWLRGLADAGRLDGLLTAIAIDGKWLRSGNCWGPWTCAAPWSPPTRPMPSGRPRSTSPGRSRTAAGNRTTSC
jgi:DDE_Tnp_1-associated